MKRAIAVVLLLAGTARADTNTSDAGLYIFAGGVAASAAFTIYNLATLGEQKSDLYAISETVLTVPQTIVFSGVAAMTDDGDAWRPAVLAAWTTALAIHGIYTLASDDERDTTAGRTVMISIGESF